MGGAVALAHRPSSEQLLSEIGVPAIVLVGLEDSVYPIEIARSMHQRISGSTLEVLPDVAHAAIIEAPERSAQAIMSWTASSLSTRAG